MASDNDTETEPINVPPLGVIVGVLTVFELLLVIDGVKDDWLATAGLVAESPPVVERSEVLLLEACANR